MARISVKLQGIRDALILAAIGMLGVGSTVAVSLFFGLLILATISFIQGLLLWAVWNIATPWIDFIPKSYQHLDFLTAWAGVAVIRIAKGIILGSKGKK